jgi:hypothetical protein
LSALIFQNIVVYAHRKSGDATQAHQKPPGIFQLLDQLENVAEKLLAE